MPWQEQQHIWWGLRKYVFPTSGQCITSTHGAHIDIAEKRINQEQSWVGSISILNIGPPKPRNSILPDKFTTFLGNCFCVERLCPHLVCMTRKGIDNSHGCENHQKTWLQNAARVLDIVVFEVASITAQAAKITKILGCSKICKSFRAKPLDCCLEFSHQSPLRTGEMPVVDWVKLLLEPSSTLIVYTEEPNNHHF